MGYLLGLVSDTEAYIRNGDFRGGGGQLSHIHLFGGRHEGRFALYCPWCPTIAATALAYRCQRTRLPASSR